MGKKNITEKLLNHNGFAYVLTNNDKKIIISCKTVDHAEDGIYFIASTADDLNGWSIHIDDIKEIIQLLN